MTSFQPFPFSVLCFPHLPRPEAVTAHLWSPCDSPSPFHPVLPSQLCSATLAQSFRAASHVGMLLGYGLHLPSSSMGASCTGCLWFSKAKHFAMGQPARYRVCHLSFWWVLQGLYTFCMVRFVNVFAKLKDSRSCVRKEHPHCFLEEALSITPLGIRSNEGAGGSCHISLKLPGGRSQNSDPTARSLSAAWEFLTNYVLLFFEQ